MSRYVTIGYEGGRFPIPIRVREASVIGDKSAVIPRIEKTFGIFARDVKPEKRDRLLEKIIGKTTLLNGRDNDTQKLLNGRAGVYDRNNGRVYVDANSLSSPSLVEHEIIHLMGETRLWGLSIPRRLVNQHAVAANIAVTLLDTNDVLGFHDLGQADDADFRKLQRYKWLPIEFQEGIKDFQNTCFRVGNYARETGKGHDFLYRMSK